MKSVLTRWLTSLQYHWIYNAPDFIALMDIYPDRWGINNTRYCGASVLDCYSSVSTFVKPAFSGYSLHVRGEQA